MGSRQEGVCPGEDEGLSKMIGSVQTHSCVLEKRNKPTFFNLCKTVCVWVDGYITEWVCVCVGRRYIHACVCVQVYALCVTGCVCENQGQCGTYHIWGWRVCLLGL